MEGSGEMLKQIKVWIAECDRCKKKCAYSYRYYDCFSIRTKKALIKTLTDENNMETWKITKNKILCGDCR